MVPRSKPGINPFYVLLVLVGVAFVITAFAFWLMASSAVHPRLPAADLPTDHPLWRLLEQHGDRLMLWELVALAVLTFAAIGIDGYWARRRKQRGVALSDLNKTRGAQS